MKPDMSLRQLKGVGDKTEKLFEKVGVFTVGDILLHFPHDYIQYPEWESPGEPYEDSVCAIRAQINKSVYSRAVKGMQIVSTVVSDSARKVRLTWFRQPYIKNVLKAGEDFVFYGKLKYKNNEYIMEQPAIFTPDIYSVMIHGLQPVYGLTRGLSNKLYQKAVKEALECCEPFAEFLPEDILEKRGFLSYQQAIKQCHFPKTTEELLAAHRRLAYNEFYLFIKNLTELKKGDNRPRNEFSVKGRESILHMAENLSFSLTDGQRCALDDILNDMEQPQSMERLLQGDVGSGKTIVAFLSMFYASQNDLQSAIMVPTEVLAQQHFESLTSLCRQQGVNAEVFLLTGSMTAKQKKEIKRAILQSPGAMVVGTHALIQEDCEFLNLGLVITDEQHRFGVRQRDHLAQKGKMPHLLVMSATPIPRTLAIILYGDLSISTIRELPKNRKPIKNCVVKRDYYKKALEFIGNEVDAGHQAYVICPLVEESEAIDAANAVDEAKRLQEVFRGKCTVGCLHGKLKPAEKNRIMDDFSKNKIQILVSTTVVEVGVNVPNATVMMVESAERFGLAQLHQLRGRVGRGVAQSYCIFMDYDRKNSHNPRLEILNQSNDGFEIAQKDLELRGPGDLFGIRQSGELNFYLADIYQDADLLQMAAEDINEQMRKDVLTWV